MRKKILYVLEKIINWLETLHNKFSLNDNEKVVYSSLSPIDNGDENGHYSNALFWALKNRKKEDIKNIALTGPYGSGKSSILKTFQKNYKGKDLKFLNISLATFVEEKPKFDENGKPITIDKSALLKLIEISILEQIFYHENDNKIPDSRFKKIKSYSFWQLFFYSLGYLILLISIWDYFNPYFIQSLIKDVAINNSLCDFIYYVERLIIAFGLFIIILKSSRLISSITINKLQIQNAEIGIGENLNKSILNHHIDELLYFFSARPYNVVIIEDLDRFEETEIFTKLRELNLLLNNSKKTKKKEIVFVYAVRDNMFIDKERTKFFDFIIPVIPVINSSNSSEILFKKRNTSNFKLSDGLIEDMSFFIDDMRLLHNISNEFYLYREKLNENLSQDKLFAIITYKNIYPTDFMLLSCNQGDLYKILENKSSYQRKAIQKIETDIEKNNEEIKFYENIFVSNLKDLRGLYVVRIIEKLIGFKSFLINGEPVSLDEVVEDHNFEYLKKNSFSYTQMYIYYGNVTEKAINSSVNFREIEKSIDKSKSYVEKESEINDIQNGKITALKYKNQELENEKQITRSLKIAELLKSTQNLDIIIDGNKDQDFILLLLRNGYVAEDYIDYISLFHEESISRSDYQFHINIKNETKQSFDYKLFKIEKLIPKINLNDFQTEYILNYNLMDFLLANPSIYKQQIQSISNKLKDESKISIEFIKGYFEISEQTKNFTNLLSNKWHNIWNFIESSPDFSNKQKETIFKNIIEYSDIKDIQEISKQSTFKQNILSNPLFLKISDDQKQLKSIIENLQLSFDTIDFDNSPDEMLSFVYENNFYKINRENIVSIIKKNGEFNQIEFDNSNFFAIKKSKANNLIDYVEKNLNEYLEKIFFDISTNVNESEESLIELLNHKNINFKNKEYIIEQVNTRISLISKINDYDLQIKLFSQNKVTPKWDNLLHCYYSQNGDELQSKPKEIPVSITTFINIIENAEELSRMESPESYNEINLFDTFWRQLIQNKDIEDSSYNLILNSCPWWYSDLNFTNLSESKIKLLINNTCIEPIVESYNSIKEAYDGLNIHLLEERKIDYFKIINELTFDSKDLELVLKSKKINNSEKLQILKNCQDEIIITNNNLKLLSLILIEENSFVVSDNILDSILTNNQVPKGERIKLFIKNSSKYDNLFIETFLNNLGGDYSEIPDIKLKAKVEKNEENQKLLNVLEKKGYISSFSVLESHYRVNHRRK